jgi:hypothetical protein
VSAQKPYSSIRIIVLYAFMPLICGMSWGAENKDTKSEVAARLKAERAKLDTPLKNPARIDRLRVKAARAGDESERESIRVQLKSGDLLQQSHAIEMAEAVGGNDMIRGLGDLLSTTNNGGCVNWSGIPLEKRPKNRQGDVIVLPPRVAAAMALEKLLANPPIGKEGKKIIYVQDETAITIWRKWWEENKAKYEEE